jgi:hypothetical protein
MDIVLAILPWKVIKELKLHKLEKFGALTAMAIGVL